ncbi:MAG: hypothetical protein QME79_00335 [Bacillota bacterium]|nr:hypothetical protein [Bacillota bacterium]
MRGRWLAVAFLGGVLLVWGAGSAPLPAAASGPEWTAARRLNPAMVAFLDPGLGGRVDLSVTFLDPNPLELNYVAGYAVPDNGAGAAAVVVADSRLLFSGGVEETKSFGYTWGRRWRPGLAAGATVRLVQYQLTVDGVGPTPAERGLGLDFGVVYQPEERTWAGVAVCDAFDTTLKSDGGSSTVIPATVQLTLGRQVSPALRLTLEGRDVAAATLEGSSWVAEATLTRGRLSYHAAVTAAAETGWSAGVTAELGQYRVDLTANGAGARTGGALGVTVQW